MSDGRSETCRIGGGTVVVLPGHRMLCRFGTAAVVVTMKYDEAMAVRHGDFRFVVHAGDSVTITREMPSDALPVITADLQAAAIRAALVPLSASESLIDDEVSEVWRRPSRRDDPPPEPGLVRSLIAAPAAPPRPLVSRPIAEASLV